MVECGDRAVPADPCSPADADFFYGVSAPHLGACFLGDRGVLVLQPRRGALDTVVLRQHLGSWRTATASDLRLWSRTHSCDLGLDDGRPREPLRSAPGW